MKTAIYLRQSLDRNQNHLAIDRQREACLELCQRHGWADTVEYIDNDTSASTGRRPAVWRLLGSARILGAHYAVGFRVAAVHAGGRRG